MAYDSSQLLNLVNNANAMFSKNYPALNNLNANPSNPFGPFNDISKIKLVPVGTSSFSASGGNTTGNSLYNQMLNDLYSNNNSTLNKNWSSFGYNALAGSRLASIAQNNAVGFRGYCARYVKNAISQAGLGTYVSGNGCDMDTILRQNPKFREIPASTDVNSLPAGCVLVYHRGSQGYNSLYGHTEITDGKRRGISDGITQHLRKPDAIFMPVAA